MTELTLKGMGQHTVTETLLTLLNRVDDISEYMDSECIRKHNPSSSIGMAQASFHICLKKFLNIDNHNKFLEPKSDVKYLTSMMQCSQGIYSNVTEVFIPMVFNQVMASGVVDERSISTYGIDGEIKLSDLSMFLNITRKAAKKEIVNPEHRNIIVGFLKYLINISYVACVDGEGRGIIRAGANKRLIELKELVEEFKQNIVYMDTDHIFVENMSKECSVALALTEKYHSENVGRCVFFRTKRFITNIKGNIHIPGMVVKGK